MDKRFMAFGTSMLVLKLLEQQSMYGYQIIRELEQQGAVTSVQKLADNGRQRKYYQITAQGRGLLREKTAQWDTYQAAVNRVMGGVQFAYETI